MVEHLIIMSGEAYLYSFNQGHPPFRARSRIFHLLDVKIVHGIAANIISVSQFTKHNSCSVEFYPYGYFIRDCRFPYVEGAELVLTGGPLARGQGLYYHTSLSHPDLPEERKTITHSSYGPTAFNLRFPLDVLAPAGGSSWLLDSGAAIHITIDASLLYNLWECAPGSFVFADGRRCSFSLCGDAYLRSSITDDPPLCRQSRTFHLFNVKVVDTAIDNVISLSKFTMDNSCTVEFKPLGYYITDGIIPNIWGSRLVLAGGDLDDRDELYYHESRTYSDLPDEIRTFTEKHDANVAAYLLGDSDLVMTDDDSSDNEDLV